jgi:hypothetical protein
MGFDRDRLSPIRGRPFSANDLDLRVRDSRRAGASIDHDPHGVRQLRRELVYLKCG